VIWGGNSKMGNSTFWGPDWDSLAKQDPEISSLLLKELERARGVCN